MKEKILREAVSRYGGQPEYLWRTHPDFAVLRHGDNGKWYALFMNINRNKLGLSGDGGIDIVNLKCDPVLAGSLRASGTVLPAYHMNKENAALAKIRRGRTQEFRSGISTQTR